MASPYTSQSASGYNSSPPADDGSQTASNQIHWSTVKTKLADPAKTLADNINSAVVSAFAKTLDGAGISSTAIDYQVLSSDQGKVIRATAASVVITTPDATTVSSPFVFAVLNNSSGSITVDGSASQTVDGSATISIPSAGGVVLVTDGSNWFTQGQNYVGTISAPQGRLTLTSATPILAADVTAATAVYYTPYLGNLVPIYNGTIYQMRTFAELTLTLVANSNYAASTLYDLFIFDSSGTVTFGMGPAWSTSTAGAGARGTGAGTTELERKLGFWTNKVSMTARNGASTYTVAANQGTYVGSIFMDGSNGQVSCYVGYGQSRKWGIWNAYNRKPIVLKCGDGTASWNYNTNTVRQSRADATNTLAIFCGLPEERVELSFNQAVGESTGAANIPSIAIGVNSTTTVSGTRAGSYQNGGGGSKQSQVAEFDPVPFIGINNINALENGATTGGTFYGTEADMLLKAVWPG